MWVSRREIDALKERVFDLETEWCMYVEVTEHEHSVYRRIPVRQVLRAIMDASNFTFCYEPGHEGKLTATRARGAA